MLELSTKELPVDTLGKTLKNRGISFSKFSTEWLEASEFHNSMIFFSFFNDFRRYSYSMMIGSPRTELQSEYREMLRAPTPLPPSLY